MALLRVHASIGVRGISADTGIQLGIELHTGSSAAKGIATRRGLGKVKHLETRTLWVQEKVESGEMIVRKVDGNNNVADLLTKYLAGCKIQQFVNALPMMYSEGRHSLAPKLQGS